VLLQLFQPAGDELLYAGHIKLRVGRGILAKIGGGKLEQSGSGTQSVFLEMHKRAGELDDALEKIAIRAVPVREPQILQHIVRLVEKLAVEAVEITEVARVQRPALKSRDLRGDARVLAAGDGGRMRHAAMLAMILLGGNDKAGQQAKVFCGVCCGLIGRLPGHQLGNQFLCKPNGCTSGK